MAASMPSLPAKDMFRFLESDVIEKRRGALENYMSRIVIHLPTILRSEQLSDFLGIADRINTIKTQLGLSSLHMSGGSAGGAGGASHGSSSPSSANGSGAADVLNLDTCELILDLTKAEQERNKEGALCFDEDELGRLEESIRDLAILLRAAAPRDVLSKKGKPFRLLSSVTARWPRLRSTAEVGTGIDFRLLPRAMQAEEDLQRLIDEYRSLIAAHSLSV